MEMQYLMSVVFPALEQFYKLLAFVVALYFPVAMLTWLAIDKLQKTRDARTDVRRPEPSGGRGQVTHIQNSQHNP